MKFASPRPMTEDDLGKVAEIEIRSEPAPWSVRLFKEELSQNPEGTLVLTDDETDEVVLGFIIFRIQADHVSLLKIATHPEWRGLGVAQSLMRLMTNQTVRDEIPKIILEVRTTNTAAIKLYEKLGFQKVAHRKSFYQNGDDAYVYEIKTSDLSSTLH